MSFPTIAHSRVSNLLREWPHFSNQPMLETVQVLPADGRLQARRQGLSRGYGSLMS